MIKLIIIARESTDNSFHFRNASCALLMINSFCTLFLTGSYLIKFPVHGLILFMVFMITGFNVKRAMIKLMIIAL